MYLLMYTQLVIAYIAAFSRLNKLKHGYDLTKIQTDFATCPDEMRCIAFLTLLVMQGSFFPSQAPKRPPQPLISASGLHFFVYICVCVF